MVGCPFITQSLVWDKKRALGKLFKSTARSGRDDLTYTVADQPIKYLCRCRRAYGSFTKCDLLSLVLCYVDGITFGYTEKFGHLDGFRLVCIFCYILTEEGKNAFLRQLQI